MSPKGYKELLLILCEFSQCCLNFIF